MYSEYFKCFVWIYDVCAYIGNWEKIGKHAHFPTWQWKLNIYRSENTSTNSIGGSRNFKTGERGRILKSGVCFDHTPSHIRYIFEARVVNKIHIENIVSWLKSRVIVKIYKKQTPNIFQTGGGGRRSWVRLIGFKPKMNIANLNDWIYLAASIELPQILPPFFGHGHGIFNVCNLIWKTPKTPLYYIKHGANKIYQIVKHLMCVVSKHT